MASPAKSTPRKRARPKKASAAQSQRFIDKARELGVDESGAEFEHLFGKIAKANPTSKNER